MKLAFVETYIQAYKDWAVTASADNTSRLESGDELFWRTARHHVIGSPLVNNYQLANPEFGTPISVYLHNDVGRLLQAAEVNGYRCQKSDRHLLELPSKRGSIFLLVVPNDQMEAWARG